MHVISISTEYYFFVQYGFMQLIHQYEWLEADLRVNKLFNLKVDITSIIYG